MSENTVTIVTAQEALKSVLKHRIALYNWGGGNFYFRPTDEDELAEFSWTVNCNEFFSLLVKVIKSQANQWPTSAGHVHALEQISRVLVYNKNWDTDKSDANPTFVAYNVLMATNPEFEEIINVST